MGPHKMQSDENDATKSPTSDGHHRPEIPRVSNCSTDKDSGLSLCRVCHCVEPDSRGQSALGFLGIVPPSRATSKDVDVTTGSKKDAPKFVEFFSPEGEIFVCATDIESGPLHQHDHLMDLGCSCKNELALAHYACALKWFISHGSTVCEICGNAAVNVRPSDFNKVLASLKHYEALRERTYTGELPHLQYGADTTVDPDAVAAIRRQRLSEISAWFNPHNSHVGVSQEHLEQPPLSPSNNSVVEHSVVVATAVHATRSLERSGVFVAMGLAVIVLAWFVAPHVENCYYWSSYASRRLVRVDCNNIPEICFPKNPVWFYAILGNHICILVPCFWGLGFADSEHPLLMSIESMFSCGEIGLLLLCSVRYCIPVYIQSFAFSLIFLFNMYILDSRKDVKLCYWV